MGEESSVTSQLALVRLHQMRQSFIDSVRGSADQADAFFNNWLGQNPAGLTLAVGSVETAADLATGASAIIEPISSGHTTLGNVAGYLQQHQQQTDNNLAQAEVQNFTNAPALGGILATKALVDFSGMFVEPLRLGEGVLQGTPSGVGADGLRLLGWAPGFVEGPAAAKAAKAMTAREMPAASNAVAKLSAELTSALPHGNWCTQIVGVGKLLTGTAKGYVPGTDLLESVPPAALARLKAGGGMGFDDVAAQVHSLGMKIREAIKVEKLGISDPAEMTQFVENFVRRQGKSEVTFFDIGNQTTDHMLGAFVDGEGVFRLFDFKGSYNGFGEVFESNVELAGSQLYNLMSVEGTRYLPRWVAPKAADVARSILSVIGIQVIPVFSGNASATLEQMRSDFTTWQARLTDTIGTIGTASMTPLPGSSLLDGASPDNVVPSSTNPPSVQAPKATLLQGRVEQADWASPGISGNEDSSAASQGSVHMAGGASSGPVGAQPAGANLFSAPDADAGPDPSSPDGSAPDSLMTIHGTLPDPATYSDNRGDGDQETGPAYFDDQVGAVGTADDSGPSDTGDPAVLTTQATVLPTNSAAGSTDTGGESDDDSTSIATPGTVDWLNPGAENDPLFADSDNEGDGDQETGPGMVDDQGNVFGPPADDGGLTDTGDPDAELSTQIAWGTGSLDDSGSATDAGGESGDDSTSIATPGTVNWLNPGAEDSPLFNDSDTDWTSGLSIPDQPGGGDDSNDPSTEIGPSASTMTESDSGSSEVDDNDQVNVDPFTDQPYAENTDTGQTQSIQASGVDNMGNPIYQAPTAAGGDIFEVDDSGATISSLGPLDTSGWDTTPQEGTGAWGDTSGALDSGEPGSSSDDSGSGDDGSGYDDSGSGDDGSSYDSSSYDDGSGYDDSSSYDSSSVSEGAPVEEAPAASDGGDDGD